MPSITRGLEDSEHKHCHGGADEHRPGPVQRGASGCRDVETVQVSTNCSAPAAPRPTKIDSQGNQASSAPDPSIPATPPEPHTPAQMPTAFVRSSRG